MSSFFFLFFQRNFRQLSKTLFLTFLLLLLPSVFFVGTASFEKVSLGLVLSETKVDYEIQGSLTLNYSPSNLTLLTSHFNTWRSAISRWEKHVIADGFVLFSLDFSNNDSLLIGIDFFLESSNMKKSSIVDNVTTVFGTEVNVEEFLIVDSLPFNLDLIININTFLDFQNSSSNFLDPQIGYFADFSSRFLPTFTAIDEVNSIISYEFQSYFVQHELISDIKTNSPDFSIVHPFKQPFDSVIFLISFITILSVIWLIETMSRNYITQIKSQLSNFNQRGLSSKQKNILQVVFPVVLDIFALLFLFLIFWGISQIFSLNLLSAYIISALTFLIVLYRRLSRLRETSSDSDRSRRRFIISYVLILILISLVSLVIARVFSLLLPPWFSSLVIPGVTIIQYYIATILFTELLLYLIRKQFSKVKGLPALVNKAIFAKNSHLRTWFQSFLLLMWSMIIITSSIQSFNANFEIDSTLSSISDVKLAVSLPLHNVTQLRSLPEVKFVFPVSHSEEQYFVPYDLYLMNLTMLYEYRPEVFQIIDPFTIDTSSTYISEDLAAEFNFEDGDLFPTKFGHNVTNIVINQPLIVSQYFPLVKPLEGKPFVAASYHYEFENITIVNQILVDFKENITVDQGVKAIERIIGPNYQIEKDYPVLDYNSVFLIYQYVFLLLSLLIIVMNYLQFIKSLKPTFASFNARGMQTKEIRRQFLKQSLFLQFYPFVASIVLGTLFIFLQMPTMVYQIDLYASVQIKVGLSILLVILLPVTNFFVSILLLKDKFRRNAFRKLIQ
ncbi:MAG: hypothetical protein KGD64_14045 [Candidatus Heimdallarchaeota archaeon]|nr:hypothetical protein [Candidatus Heimdallarchaeota archaeon]